MYLYFDMDPQPKRRPRFVRRGAKAYATSDVRDKDYTKRIQLLARPQVERLLIGPLRCEINFYIKPPKTVKRKYPTSKRSGDVDNLAKAILDSLNSIAYEDDSQIVSLTCSKYYREVSGIEVTLYPLN